MFKYKTKIWFRNIFKFTKGDTLRVLLPEIIILSVFTFCLTFVELRYLEALHLFKDAIAVYSLVGFVLSLLLVFRTNTAYDRWWEGRIKWGELTNDTRSLALKINSAPTTKEDKIFFQSMIVNYVYTLKWHLRKQSETLVHNMDESTLLEFNKASHKPSFIAGKMYDRIQEMIKDKRISENDFLTMDVNLNNFSNITGACERILNTPMPYSYSIFLKKFIFIYTVTLPIGFVSTFQYGTILIAVFIFYVLVSMELLAEEIEDPFGTDANDLDLNSMCSAIQENVEDILKQ